MGQIPMVIGVFLLGGIYQGNLCPVPIYSCKYCTRNETTTITAIGNCQCNYEKKRWTSVSQQFHKYKHNKQLTLTSNHWKWRPQHDIWRWKSTSWIGKGTNCDGVKQINGSTTLSTWQLDHFENTRQEQSIYVLIK